MRKAKRLLAAFITAALMLNSLVLPTHAAPPTDTQTTATHVSMVRDYAAQLRKTSRVDVTNGNMSWDTEKKKYSWAYFNGLMLDAFMMLDPSGFSSYVEGFYRANIDSNGKILNLEASGSPAKGALDNIEPIRAAFDLLSGSESNRIKKGIQEMYSQLMSMTAYPSCGGNFVHKQETDGTPTSSWKDYPVALDGLYMAQPFLMECANAIDQGKLTLKDLSGRTVTSESIYASVYDRFTWIYANLFNPATGLYDHGYSPDSRSTNGVSWSRAIGWYAMALVDVIEMMPAGSRKTELISELPRLFDGMLRYQDQDTGLWYNITAYDDAISGNNLETSGTAMMAYALFKAYKNSWVTDSKYARAGLEAFNGVIENKMSGVSGNYKVIDTYRSSGVNIKPSSYTTAPYTTDEAKGVGALIMAATMANTVAQKLEDSDSGNSGSGGSGSGSDGGNTGGDSGNTGGGSGGSDSGETGGDSGSGGNTDSGDNGGGSDSGEEPGSGSGDTSDDPLTITIHDNKGTAAGVFEAYQIFTGTLSDDSSIAWGSGILTTDGKLTVGGASYTAYELIRAYTYGQVSVGDMLDAIEKNLSQTFYSGSTDDNSDAVIELPASGYYFVRNAEGSAKDGEAYTRFIVRVIENESIHMNVKTDAPSVDKKVKNQFEADTQYRDANNGKIGDYINYKITTNVPDLTEYDSYVFTLQDTMSPGLTYVEDSLKVMLSSEEMDGENDYTANIAVNADGETEISIAFHDFIQYKGMTGTAITVTYDALINENAIVGEEGNPNAVYLTYSNDPNHTGEGNIGRTPTEWAKTYIAHLMAYKYDGKNGKPLKDATFTLVGTQDRSYFINEDETLQETEISISVVSDENGFVDFGTLGAGTYQITEIIAPNGYNLLKDSLELIITCSSDDMEIHDGSEKCEWTITLNGELISDKLDTELINVTVDPSIYLAGIQNESGAILPTTGGIGTTVFYLSGVLLLMSALILWIRRRMQV